MNFWVNQILSIKLFSFILLVNMLKKQRVLSKKYPKLRTVRLNLRKILMNMFYDQESIL